MLLPTPILYILLIICGKDMCLYHSSNQNLPAGDHFKLNWGHTLLWGHTLQESYDSVRDQDQNNWEQSVIITFSEKNNTAELNYTGNWAFSVEIDIMICEHT